MDTLAARLQMVDQQIRTWEVLDPRVLEALSAVPREAFVPPEYRELAFADTPIPIGFGQVMLAPKLQGRILQALGVSATDSVLEVGSGTGYLSACFSLLGRGTPSIRHHRFAADLRRALRTVTARGRPSVRDGGCGARHGRHPGTPRGQQRMDSREFVRDRRRTLDQCHGGTEVRVLMIKELTPQEFVDRRAGSAEMTLVDVREDWETKLAPVPAAVLHIPMG